MSELATSLGEAVEEDDHAFLRFGREAVDVGETDRWGGLEGGYQVLPCGSVRAWSGHPGIGLQEGDRSHRNVGISFSGRALNW